MEKEDEDEIKLVLILEKAFTCDLTACVEHVGWRAGTRKTQGQKTFQDLENGEDFTILLDKWINILKQKHFPMVQKMDLITVVFGRGSRPV